MSLFLMTVVLVGLVGSKFVRVPIDTFDEDDDDRASRKYTFSVLPT